MLQFAYLYVPVERAVAVEREELPIPGGGPSRRTVNGGRTAAVEGRPEDRAAL